MTNSKVGGEVDAFCTRCKMTLGHTILAMVGTRIARVRCNTCNGDHVFRKESSSSAKEPKHATTKASKAAAAKATDRPRTAAGKAKVAVTRAQRESAAARRRKQTDAESEGGEG